MLLFCLLLLLLYLRSVQAQGSAFAPRPVKRKGSLLVQETRKAGEDNDFDLKKDPLFKGDNTYHEDELYLTQDSFDRLKKKTNFSKFNPLRLCGVKNLQQPGARLVVVGLILATFVGAMVLIIVYFFRNKFIDHRRTAIDWLRLRVTRAIKGLRCGPGQLDIFCRIPPNLPYQNLDFHIFLWFSNLS